MIAGHEESAARSLTVLTEAKAICSLVALAMYEGKPDREDVRYAIDGVARLIDKAADIAAMLVDEMAEERRAGESEVRT